MTMKSFIYDKKEYVKTGRKAIKDEKTGIKNGEIQYATKEMIEIRPINVPEEDLSFNVWVNPADLFEVVTEN